MRADRLKPLWQSLRAGQPQVGGRARHTDINESLKQIRDALGEPVNAYEEHRKWWPGGRATFHIPNAAIIHAFRDALTEEAFIDLRWHDLLHEAISRLVELTDLRQNEIMAISGHLTPAILACHADHRADRLGERLPGGRLNPQKGEKR